MRSIPLLAKVLNNNVKLPHHLLILIAAFFLFSCQRKSEKNKDEKAQPTNSLYITGNCYRQLTSIQTETIKGIVSYIRDRVRLRDYCRDRYNPANRCNESVDISQTCGYIYDDLSFYLDNHLSLTFCISRSFGSDWLAAVDLSYSKTHIFLSDEFFSKHIDEQRRSVIHELYHLQGNNQVHSEYKDCQYYQNWTLKAEHCLTCTATLVPPELSTCSGGKNGLFILK